MTRPVIPGGRTPPELTARHLPHPFRWPCEPGSPQAFSDEPGAGHTACMGADSEAVARRILSSCGGLATSALTAFGTALSRAG